MDRRGRQRPWWSFTFTEIAVICGSVTFLLALLLPAIEIAKYTSKHGHLRVSITPEQAQRLQRLEQDWSERAFLYRSACLGAAVSVVIVTGGFVIKWLRDREVRSIV